MIFLCFERITRVIRNILSCVIILYDAAKFCKTESKKLMINGLSKQVAKKRELIVDILIYFVTYLVFRKVNFIQKLSLVKLMSKIPGFYVSGLHTNIHCKNTVYIIIFYKNFNLRHILLNMSS